MRRAQGLTPKDVAKVMPQLKDDLARLVAHPVCLRTRLPGGDEAGAARGARRLMILPGAVVMTRRPAVGLGP